MPVTKDGWLELAASGLPPVIRIPSARSNGLDVPKPLGVVWHWTGGVGHTPKFATNLAESIRTYNRVKDRPASWHFLVARDGRILQSVPVTMGAWHVGRPGRIGGKMFGNINRATVGIELENAGLVKDMGGAHFEAWPFDGTAKLPDTRLLAEAAGALYDDFPEEQVAAAQRLLTELVLWAKWDRSVCSYGHRDFDPERKIDPGPVWAEKHLPRILDGVFGPG